MKTIFTSTLWFSILLAVATSGVAQRSELKDTTDSQYKVGQVWSYWTRPHEKTSTFVVVKVEKHPTLRNIVHIALRGLKIRKPKGGFIETLNFLPLVESAIDSSGPKLLTEKVDLPDYEKDYRRWREAFDTGRRVVLTISIAHAVEVVEASLHREAFPAEAKGENKSLSRSRPFIYQVYHLDTNKTEVTASLGSDSEMPRAGMVFPEQFGIQIPFQSGIVLGAAHYDYEGATPSGVRSARFTFVTKQKDAYQVPPMFTISVEGQSIHEGEAELYQSSYEVNGRQIADQWITLRVPIDVFLRVAGANNVEFKLGAKSYKPANFQQKYLRALAKIIEPQSK